MKVSRTWLQKYFDAPLPPVAELSDLFTFHAFEVEEVLSDDVFDLKVLPDRAGYALSHRGIASELSAILNVPMKYDPLRTDVPVHPVATKLDIQVDGTYVNRHMGALVRGVTVGPSPAWLKDALESVGQRSINNIVDITNYVMLDLGQPMHAFDADKITWSGDTLKINIRKAVAGEKMTILTGEEYTLTDTMYVIADATSGTALDIAGLKGGLASGITESTKDLFVSVGNYDAVLLRRMAQKLKLFTDASLRYQNRPSTELNAYGMRDVLALIADVAGGTVEGVVDVWAQKPEVRTVRVTAHDIEQILGAPYTEDVVADVCARLKLPCTKDGDTFVITPPFERTDLVTKQDMAEEVGRIVGYDHVLPVALPTLPFVDFTDRRKRIEAVRELLVAEGYNEVSTYSFQDVGDTEMALPLADDKKFLRVDLAHGHAKAVAQNAPNIPLFGVSDLRMFEIGHVWPKGEEQFVLGITYWIGGKKAEEKIATELTRMQGLLEAFVQKPIGVVVRGNTLEVPIDHLADSAVIPDLKVATDAGLGAFVQFSQYPFVLRDVALWVPESVTPADVTAVMRETGTALLGRIDAFDSFTKEGRTSYAFHLVFQSMDRTLTDDEVGKIMTTMTAALTAKGWEVR